MTTEIKIQHANAPIASFYGPDGKQVFVYVTPEWRRPLEQLAALVEDLKTRVEDLEGT